MLRLAGDRVRGQLGLDERRGVERLLVAQPGSRLVPPPPEMPGQP